MGMLAYFRLLLLTFIFLVLAVGCSGGGGSEETPEGQRGGADSANFDCDGNCPNQNLTVEDVTRILTQATNGASALGVAATIVVLDRPANVLAAYRMPGAMTTSVITSESGVSEGLEGAVVPAEFCAISKAGTSSFFSSQGNAFTTRTANQVLQEHFNPGEARAPSGPLFGVQFSQGLCSDINLINPDLLPGVPLGGNPLATGLVGPRPLPLGFSAQSGSVPLYKNGDMVGSIGVELDGVYGRDAALTDVDDDIEERIALYGSIGFEAPSQRVASTIFVRGKSLRFTDLDYFDLAPLPDTLAPIDPAQLLNIPGFTNGVIRRGAVYGTPESGFLRTTRAGVEVEVLVDGAQNVRFPTRAGDPLPGGAQLTASEVDALLTASVLVADKTRAQVRRPRDTAARVATWITDTNGNVLGFVRSKDTILDSTDVTLQKGRAAAFFSSPDAADRLIAAGLGGFVQAAQDFFGPDVFRGGTAWSTTALGNIARPFFPDGIDSNPNGPLSLPFPGKGGARNWSIFNTGLQLDLYINALVAPLSGVIPDSCTDAGIFGKRLANGVQFFAGGFPLYRGNTLIGSISSSGDGTEQDDLIPFYASSRRGLDEAGFTSLGDPVSGFNAPKAIRADQLDINFPQARLRYVACPEAPFRGSNVQDVCGDL